jgi:cytochrome P450
MSPMTNKSLLEASTNDVPFDPLDPAVRADPYPHYRRLRQHHPVYFVPSLNAYAVSRYEDVRNVLSNHSQFSSDPLIKIAFGEFNPAGDARYLLSSDPPDHTRLRALVNKALSNRYLTEIRGEIEATVHRLLDDLPRSREFDFIERFSSPLPVKIVGDLLGVESDMYVDFRRWSNNVTAGGNADTLSEAQRREIRADANDFRNYFLARIDAARRSPQGNLIGALVAAEEHGQKLSADEVLALCVLLLIAGNETTTTMLANAMLCLRDFPSVEAEIRADRSLIPNFIDETLRHSSPVQMLFRRATSDTSIAGVPIAKDQIVMPIYASANRDEAMFPRPETLDLHRPDLRKHVAFGWGIHMCVGRALANLEGDIALNGMLDRFATFEVTTDEVELLDAFYLRGPKNLRVIFR